MTASLISTALQIAGPIAQIFVTPAFNGCVSAAHGLAVSIFKESSGKMVLLMWSYGVKKPAFREFLSKIWDSNSAYVINAARTRYRLSEIFKYAEFPYPSHMSPTVRVWRGTREVTAKIASLGFSWTTSPNTAHWFATHPDRRGALIVSADISRDDVVNFNNDGGGESEVTIMRPPFSFIEHEVTA